MNVDKEEIKVVMVDMTGEVVSEEDYSLSDMLAISQALAVVMEDGVPIENATLVRRSDGDGLPENVMGAFLWSADTESMNKARLELAMRGKTWVGFKRG